MDCLLTSRQVSPWLENSNVIHYTTVVDPDANRLKLVRPSKTVQQQIPQYPPFIPYDSWKRLQMDCYISIVMPLQLSMET